MKKRDIVLMVIAIFIFALPYILCISSIISEFIPERKKEIDFTLKYSLNGEVITVSDTAICEFDRHKWTFYSAPNLEQRYVIYIPSKETKEDGHQVLSFTLLDLSDVDTEELLGYNASRVYYYAGNANFYMDIGYGDNPPYDPNGVDISYIDNYGHSQSRWTSNDEAEELFGVRMISFDYKIRK